MTPYPPPTFQKMGGTKTPAFLPFYPENATKEPTAPQRGVLFGCSVNQPALRDGVPDGGAFATVLYPVADARRLPLFRAAAHKNNEEAIH